MTLLLLATALRASTITDVIRANSLPVSLGGDRLMFGINLAGQTTLTYMGIGFVYWMASAIWTNRKWDRLSHPATLYRLAWLCAGIAVTLRSGTEAAYLWAWNSADPATGAVILRLKWYVTSISFAFSLVWLGVNVLTYATIVSQLRREPLPAKVWALLPALRRPAIVAMLSLAMSISVVWLRG